MAVRASDQVTLQVLPAPSYVRTFYLLQASTLSAPSVPTTNPPAAPWSTTEPAYTAGSTNTLYTVQLVAYGDTTFEYGPVQKSSAYEAAKQAYNLAEQANTAAGNALTAANGKNKIVFNTAAASGTSYSDGDVWFQKSGTTIIGQWEFVGGAWAARTLTDAVISTLSAAKITTGTLSADRIGANSLSVSKLLVSSFENLLMDPGFEYNSTAAWTLTSPATNGTTNPRTGTRALTLPTAAAAYKAAMQTTPTLVTEGEQYRVEAWVRMAAGVSPSNGVTLRFAYGPTETSTPSSGADFATTPAGTGTTYVKISGVWTVPAGARFARLEIVLRDSGTGRTYYVDDVAMYKMTAGELVVDGAITANKLQVEEIWASEAWLDVLRAGVIEAGMVTSGFADELVLTGNSAVQVIVGQQANQAGQIAAAQSAAAVAQGTASSAEQAAAAAGAAANAANSAAADLATSQAATQAALGTLQTWFRVDSAGAHIGSTGSSFETNILPGEFNITENGVRTTWWDSGRMTVRSLEATVDLTVGKHKMEKDPTGTGTVVRSLG